ncbi:MAG: hypothetical protein R3183_03890 [Oleiphilaceae bacterium]|nr:hypothetical protein [Oleiphilaceae bacterium]
MKRLILFCLHLTLLNSHTLANQHEALHCQVAGNDDSFVLYPEQLSYTSQTFWHYQLIDGLTVLVVNRQTMRFNRLSNLNLLPHSTMDPAKPPEEYQMFSGTCAFKGEL